MKTKQLNLVYAIKDGELVHISKVEGGLKCDCICPSCNATLVARKGTKVMHHFAHHNADMCKYGYETSLHMAAKEIIAKAKNMWIPAVYLNFDSGRKPELIKDTMEIKIDDVTLEKGLDNIIPDIIVSAGGKMLIVEIYVTHAMDEEKLQKIRKMNVSTLEIDLSKRETQITEEELEHAIIESSLEKQWKYNALEEIWKSRFINVAEKRAIITRGFALHIDQCPIAIRSWRGKPYANFIDDCTGCDFFISHQDKSSDDEYKGYILCSGKARIASLEDFSLSQEERCKKYDPIQEQEKTEVIASGRCPNCGGELKQRKGKYGEFWGCGNYPHCRFTISIDYETGEIITRS
jgi:ssDNA-binding Zn-finger/Zn-ribbon topoisomerase 1